MPVSVSYPHRAFLESTLSDKVFQHLPKTILVLKLCYQDQLFSRERPQDQTSIVATLLM